MNIILGLDIGKSSIGFALVDKANNYKILNAGVRLFDAPEKAKEQTSLSKERGEFKRARNSNQNEFFRTKNIVKCMLKYNLLDAETIRTYNKSPKVINCPKSKKKHLFYIKTAEYLFYKKSNNNDVLSLRVKALTQKISNLELARILYSMNKHRGVTYDEIREIPEGSNKSLSEDQRNLKDGFQKYNDEYKSKEDSYLTVGEYLYKNYNSKFRNTDKWKNGKKVGKDYIFSIPRDDIKTEIEIIFEKQREFKNELTTKEFQDEYLEYFLWEKESPKYDTLVSPCIYNPNEKVANKHHFASQLYISLEKLFNVRYREISTKEYKPFSEEQKHIILNNSFEKIKGLSYKDIKKILNLPNIEFKGVLEEDKNIVTNFDTFIQIKKILNLEFNPLDEFLKEDSFIQNDFISIINILAYETKDSIKKVELSKLNIPDENIEKLLKLGIRGHLSYSLGVVNKICNYMLTGDIPHDAKEKIKDEYGVKSIEKTAYLPPIMETDFPLKNNHTVVRALSQVRAVVNDILKHYRKETGNSNWTFDMVTIELAREMNSKKQISNINKAINQNTKSNQEAKEFCEKYNINNPTQEQILKAKLWKLQNGIDPYIWIQNDENNLVDSYTLGRIEAEKLFDEGYCEIEHTLPYSRSLDDSQSNKTIVLASTNQNKGDKTPYEWLSKEQFEKFEKFLREKENWLAYGDARIRKLLNKDFQGVDGFKQRDIIDTQIISKYAGLYIDNHLHFWNNPNFNAKRRIYANNGKITSILRKAWAIGKKNRDTHLHHAEDAILIACSTPSLIKNISTFVGIQTELTSGVLTHEKFDRVLNKHKTLKEYILDQLQKLEIDIEKLDFKDKKARDEFASILFKILANKNYPYESFRDDFKNIIENAPVTRYVKQKTNGSIHDETISKQKNDDDKGIQIRNGISRNGEYVRCDVFKITNIKGKVTYDFVVLTARYNGVKVDNLPTPNLKDGENATFIFSVFKNELLQYSLKDKSKVIANFLKIASSIVVREPKNKETELFSKQIKGFYNSWLKTDDVEQIKEIMSDKAIQKELNLKLEKVTKLSSQVEKVTTLCNTVSNIIKTKYNINTIFTMEKMNSIQTKELRNILIEKNIVKENIELNSSVTKTIFITLSESGYIPSSRADGQKKLIDLVKLKVDCLGNIIDEITSEMRKPLK